MRDLDAVLEVQSGVAGAARSTRYADATRDSWNLARTRELTTVEHCVGCRRTRAASARRPWKSGSTPRDSCTVRRDARRASDDSNRRVPKPQGIPHTEDVSRDGLACAACCGCRCAGWTTRRACGSARQDNVVRANTVRVARDEASIAITSGHARSSGARAARTRTDVNVLRK